MTMYQHIKGMQRPFDVGALDAQGRVVIAFNIICRKAPSNTFTSEIAGLLAGLGTFGETIHVGSKSVIPPTGTHIVIIQTSGIESLRTQNIRGDSYHQPSALIRVHAEKLTDANAKACAAYDALTVVCNQDVVAA